MKRKKKLGCIAAILLPIIVAAVFGLYWAWKYYGLPEWPDRSEYKTIEERAEKALAFAKRHDMNEHNALFVDHGIPSGSLCKICKKLAHSTLRIFPFTQCTTFAPLYGKRKALQTTQISKYSHYNLLSYESSLLLRLFID